MTAVVSIVEGSFFECLAGVLDAGRSQIFRFGTEVLPGLRACENRLQYQHQADDEEKTYFYEVVLHAFSHVTGV